jgi:hypothetical protein
VRSSGRGFEDRAADEVGDKVGAGGKFCALVPGNLDVEAAQLFGVVDGGDAGEVKHTLAGVIAVHPERLQGCFLRGGGICGEKNFRLLVKAVGKIGEEFGGDFAFVAAGAEDAGYGDEFLRGSVGGRSHSAAGLLFENFKGEATMKLHAGGAKKSAHGFGGAALATDHFAEVFGMDAQFDYGRLRTVDSLYLYVFRVIHECPSNGFDELFHQAPPLLTQGL